jgi:hypothetical protein
MFKRRIQLNQRNKSTTAMLRSFVFANWRALIALFTALALVSILVTAATHHHESTTEEQACAACSVAIQKIADTPLAGLPTLVAVLFFYAVFVAESRVIAHVISIHLPPPCGPPRRSPAIC